MQISVDTKRMIPQMNQKIFRSQFSEVRYAIELEDRR